MTEPREDRILAEGVHKAFGENEVLKGVSFSVAQGSATAIIGPSGSGKTTLLRALNALDVPDAGVIRVGDVEIDFSKPVSKDQLRRYRAQSGFVFQSHNLFPHKTVLQNVTEGPIVVQKQPHEQAEADAVELLEQVGLAEKRDQYPFQLSGGQQQRVGIARALALKPKWCCSTSRPRRWIPNWSVKCCRSSRISQSRARHWWSSRTKSSSPGRFPIKCCSPTAASSWRRAHPPR